MQRVVHDPLRVIDSPVQRHVETEGEEARGAGFDGMRTPILHAIREQMRTTIIEVRRFAAAVAFKRAIRSLPTVVGMNSHLPTAFLAGDVSQTTLQLLVTQAAWANRQIFGALRAVDGFESRPGADLIVRVLDHIHVVRQIFQAHLQGIAHGYEQTRRAVFPSLAELDRECEAIDQWYVETTASLSAEELARPRDVRFTDGRIVPMTPLTMLLHVVTHTIHHRGNVDALMYQAGMERRRDGFPEYIELIRAPAT